MSTAIAYDRVGAHGEAVPGCGKAGMAVYRDEMFTGPSPRFPGFTNLGSCAIRQTGSGSWSVHAVERATDSGYPFGRRDLADAYLDYLTVNNGARARILGVQALHDYAIGSDGSYGGNRQLKRLWGHGEAVWRFGSVGDGWFWIHTELLVAVASSAAEMRHRFELLDAYDRPPPPAIPGGPDEMQTLIYQTDQQAAAGKGDYTGFLLGEMLAWQVNGLAAGLDAKVVATSTDVRQYAQAFNRQHGTNVTAREVLLATIQSKPTTSAAPPVVRADSSLLRAWRDQGITAAARA